MPRKVVKSKKRLVQSLNVKGGFTLVCKMRNIPKANGRRRKCVTPTGSIRVIICGCDISPNPTKRFIDCDKGKDYDIDEYGHTARLDDHTKSCPAHNAKTLVFCSEGCRSAYYRKYASGDYLKKVYRLTF